MREKKAPSFQFYPDKWLVDTRRLEWQTKGIFFDLLSVIWMQFQGTCSIPDDPKYIARELGCSVEEWEKARAEILWEHRPLLTIESGGLFSNGLWKEREKQLDFRNKQSENGSKGGRPKNPNKGLANDLKASKAVGYSGLSQTKAKKSSPSPSPSPSLISNKEYIATKGRTHKILQFFLEAHKEIRGVDYIVGSWKSEAGASAQLQLKIPNFDTDGFDSCKLAINAYLRSDDEYTQNSGYSFLLFCSQIQRWMQAARTAAIQRKSDSEYEAYERQRKAEEEAKKKADAALSADRARRMQVELDELEKKRQSRKQGGTNVE